MKIVLEDLLEQGYKPLYQMVEEDPALTARYCDTVARVRLHMVDFTIYICQAHLTCSPCK